MVSYAFVQTTYHCLGYTIVLTIDLTQNLVFHEEVLRHGVDRRQVARHRRLQVRGARELPHCLEHKALLFLGSRGRRTRQ